MKLRTALTHARNSVRLSTMLIMFSAVTISTADGFAQSYAGLHRWAKAHKLTGWKADSFPLLVDLFILVGELGLFLLALDGALRVRRSFMAWTDIALPFSVAAVGWSVSLWFNISDDAFTRDDQITHAVPPIAAMVGLMILLRTVHRYAAQLEGATDVPVPEPLAHDVPEVAPAAVPDVPQVPEPLAHDVPEVVPAAVPVPAVDVPERHTAVPAHVPDVPPVPEPLVHPVPAVPVPPAEVHVPAVPLAPEPVREPTAATPERHTQDDRWHKGLDYCLMYHREYRRLPGQRPLAEHLGLRNRTLAAKILTHAKELINDDTIKNGVSATPDPTG